MRAFSCAIFTASVACAACGGGYPAPTQRMADAMSAQRSAEEMGAEAEPQAQLHVKLAEEQISRAKGLMANGDNRRAEYVLVRAKADAELALALTRAVSAKSEARRAIDRATELQSQNQSNPSVQGAPR